MIPTEFTGVFRRGRRFWITYRDEAGGSHRLSCGPYVDSAEEASRRRSVLLAPIRGRRDTVATRKWDEIFAAGAMRCSLCRERKPVDAFRTLARSNGRTLDYVALNSFCRACDAERTARIRRVKRATLDGSVRLLMSNVRSRCRNKGWSCEIDEEWLIGQWHRQGGRCWFTGDPMLYDIGAQSAASGGGYRKNQRAAISVDRLDPHRGYERSNVVLCRWEANNAKQDLTIHELLDLAERLVAWRDREVTGAVQRRASSASIA